MSAAPDTQRALEPAVRFVLAIPHLPGQAERDESFARLCKALDAEELLGLAIDGEIAADGAGRGYERAKAFTEKAKAHIWSEKLLRWALELGEQDVATHLVQLQDDVVPAPNFWKAAAALVEAYPDELLGLETAHPLAPALTKDPDDTIRIVTTADGLIGVGWIIPIARIADFLEWRATKLKPGGIEAITEDTLMGIWCLATGRRVHHPVPTLIDHDVTLASTYGNDEHANRRPTVRWDQADEFLNAWDESDLEAPGFWRGLFKRVRHIEQDGTDMGMRRAHNMDPRASAQAVRHLGRFYDVTPAMARKWVVDFDEAAYRRAKADDGQRQLRRIAILRSAKREERARERVLVCTPTRGGIAPMFHAGMTALIRLFDVDVDNGLELLDSWQWQEDVVRVRSRFLRAALETDCTVVHFRDSDIAAGGTVVLGMLATGKDFVCAPYPAREGIPWELLERAIAAGDPRGLEALAYQYKIGPLEGQTGTFDETGCSPVEWMPLGCSILRRGAIEKLVEHYRDLQAEEIDVSFAQSRRTAETLGRLSRPALEGLAVSLAREIQQWRDGHRGLLYDDNVKGEELPTVGLFQLINRQSKSTGRMRLYGEDQSFCLRALDAGVQPYMYLGVGSPVSHVGDMIYRGSLESFGITRTPPRPRRPAAATAPDPEAYALDAPEDPAREPEEIASP